MDEMDFAVDTSVKRGKGLLVATIVFWLLATLALTMCVSMSVSVMDLALTAEGLDGLALIVLLPAMLIFAVAGLILSIVSSVLSGKARKKYIGAEKIIGTLLMIISILYSVASAVLPIVSILMLPK